MQVPSDFYPILEQFFGNFISVPIIGLVVFIASLWFFHEFREWRLSLSLIAALFAAALIMILLRPFLGVVGNLT